MPSRGTEKKPSGLITEIAICVNGDFASKGGLTGEGLRVAALG